MNLVFQNPRIFLLLFYINLYIKKMFKIEKENGREALLKHNMLNLSLIPIL